jgi:copper resistance protein C
MRLRRSTTPSWDPAAGRPRVLAVLASVVTGALVLVGTGMPMARAHDEVVATVPAQGAVVAAPPERVELQLSRPAQALGTRVLVTGPDGAPVSLGPVELRDTTVAQPLDPDVPSGTYTLEWQVTSADGHPVSGTSTFTVAEDGPVAPDEAGTGAGAPAQDLTAPAEAAARQDPDPSPPTAWIAIGAVALITTGGLAARQRFRRR